MTMTGRHILRQENAFRNLTFVFLGLLALMITIILQRHVHLDDAAITYRYVDRFTSGHGLTYNDHEKVFGASNPLYVFILSLVHLLGVNIESGAIVLCSFLFVASVVLVAYITTMLSDLISGFLAAMVLLVDSFFRAQALSGMESILSAVLGLMVVLAILQENQMLAGIFLGLAIWNKLDAGFLALAVATAWVIIYKKFPWKVALISFLVVLPWFIFSLFYYGTILPNSVTVKFLVHGAKQSQDYYWIVNFLENNKPLHILVPMSVISLALLSHVTDKVKIVLLTLLFWFLFHGIAFSLTNLGGGYPWYLLVLIPPVSILGYTFFGRVVNLFAKNKAFATSLLIVLFVIICWRNFKDTINQLQTRNPVPAFEAFDNDRRLAGIFLSQFADSSEVVASSFGWIAYEIKNPFNDLSLLNSKKMIEPADYFVTHGANYQSGNNPPKPINADYKPLAMFNLANDLYPGYSWFTVFGKPESKIGRLAKRFLQYRLFELPPPQPATSQFGLKNINITGIDMYSPPASGAVFTIHNNQQPVHVVFLPSFIPNTPKDKTDGVTFMVWGNDSVVYQRHVLATEVLQPVIERIPNTQFRDSIAIAFVTSSGPKGDANYDWSIWKNVKVVIGDAYIDLNRIKDKQLREAWARWNPTGEK
jgi:hypothetical protein